MRRGASVRLPIAMDINREKIGAAILFEFSNKVDRRWKFWGKFFGGFGFTKETCARRKLWSHHRGNSRREEGKRRRDPGISKLTS
jgi:hypothetical protein